jgi:phosphoglycolate phosphatase
MAETGADPSSTLMIGDTSYDMEMAGSAGVGAIGVTWGYHTAEGLLAAGAHAVIGTSEALLEAIDAHFGVTVE